MISLRVEHLSKKFNQKTIFKGLSFKHSEGILGISGPNGSGKSTLLKCLAFLLRPNEGTFHWIENEKILSREQVKPRIGFTAPYINLYNELTVLENLKFLVEADGKKADLNHLTQLIENTQISHLSGQSFGSLSTGQQQRAKIASALIRDPDILFFDEPGSNLDKKGLKLITEIVKEKSHEDKLIVLASNDPKEIELCDNVITMTHS